jgi:putative OPT family oligopeptide transporter
MEKNHSELTFRAVLSGLFVGCLIGASNITIGLKIGWTFGASITAAVVSYAIFRSFAGALRRPYTSKENLITATAGSSAGTMASAAGLTASIPALELILKEQGQPLLTFPQLILWGLGIAFLGVFFAVPLRKQMVVVEKLKYPTGTAAAETIKAMYASGEEAVRFGKPELR